MSADKFLQWAVLAVFAGIGLAVVFSMDVVYNAIEKDCNTGPECAALYESGY